MGVTKVLHSESDQASQAVKRPNSLNCSLMHRSKTYY